MDDSFVKAPISVPRLSGFDKSFQNLFTSKCGTITPVLCDELIPGSKVNLRMALSASLPPLASDTFMRCSIKAEAFFVPMRLLCGSFESWFTDQPRRYFSGGDAIEKKGTLPIIKIVVPTDAVNIESRMGVGSLSDYLGLRSGATADQLQLGISAMPFLAYHRVYHDWYRNSLIQREVFLPADWVNEFEPAPGLSGSIIAAATSPFDFYDNTHRGLGTLPEMTLADGVNILDLRQRNFGLDYFTTATPEPQQGSAEVVSFSTAGETGQFSIATLRAANSMQQFKERNNLLGNLYVEQLYGRYGVRPSDGIAQRSLFLGRGEFEVYSKGIYQTANNTEAGASEESYGNNNNPFGSVGNRFGSAYASGDNFVVNFEAKEPGYLFVMCTLVPRVTYSSGTDPIFLRYIDEGSVSEMANPILQNVGPQPIYQSELNGTPHNAQDAVFGYTDRYATFKTKQDVLHGLFRDGQSLDSFALQRNFRSQDDVFLNSAFLQIPTNYMDQITAVTGWLSDYGYMCDCYFDYKVAMPLSKYSLPSLQDPAYEHGRTIVVSKGGQKL